MAKKKRKTVLTEDMDRIDFSWEYPIGTTWTEILSKFLQHLSKEFGYTIDEYRLIGYVWAVRRDKVAALLKKNNESEVWQRVFTDLCQRTWEQQALGEQMRKDYREVLKVLEPQKDNEEE